MNDAVVVGSGPNGLSAAIVLAQAGMKVVVYETNEIPGGAVRSAPLTLPGFTHDVCSAVYPFGIASPFWSAIPLTSYGLEWIQPEVCVAHPFDDGSAAVTRRSLDATASGLGRDAHAYKSLIGPIVADWPKISRAVLGPPAIPTHPFALARFGVHALRSMQALATAKFREPHTQALMAGIAAHGMMPLDKMLTAGVGLTLGALSHVGGWPVARGGAQSITSALIAHLRSLGGDVITGTRVTSIDDLPPSRLVMCDLSPKPFLKIAGHRLPSSYRAALERYRYGRMGAFKVDWALSAPIPWTSPDCRLAGTLHLGGSATDIAASERATWDGQIPDRPFVLLSQPTIVDGSRAPAGRHTAWAYCHVPASSTVDMLDRIERQVERFAPGFRDVVLGRSVTTPAQIEASNANLVGGDIAAGVTDLGQFFTRPTWRNYATPVKTLYLCSASTPPGTGVHGMCGYWAATIALRQL